jgi:hypothetical protein
MEMQERSARKNCVLSIMVKNQESFFFQSCMVKSSSNLKPLILHGISAILSRPMLSCIYSELV